jgi:hypothetical protein
MPTASFHDLDLGYVLGRWQLCSLSFKLIWIISFCDDLPLSYLVHLQERSYMRYQIKISALTHFLPSKKDTIS